MPPPIITTSYSSPGLSKALEVGGEHAIEVEAVCDVDAAAPPRFGFGRNTNPAPDFDLNSKIRTQVKCRILLYDFVEDDCSAVLLQACHACGI